MGEIAHSLLAAFKQAGKGVREEGGVKRRQDGKKEGDREGDWRGQQLNNLAMVIESLSI